MAHLHLLRRFQLHPNSSQKAGEAFLHSFLSVWNFLSAGPQKCLLCSFVNKQDSFCILASSTWINSTIEVGQHLLVCHSWNRRGAAFRTKWSHLGMNVSMSVCPFIPCVCMCLCLSIYLCVCSSKDSLHTQITCPCESFWCPESHLGQAGVQSGADVASGRHLEEEEWKGEHSHGLPSMRGLIFSVLWLK